MLRRIRSHIITEGTIVSWHLEHTKIEENSTERSGPTQWKLKGTGIMKDFGKTREKETWSSALLRSNSRETPQTILKPQNVCVPYNMLTANIELNLTPQYFHVFYYNVSIDTRRNHDIEF